LSKAKQPCVLKRAKVLNLQIKQQLRKQTNISLATKAQAFVFAQSDIKAKQLCFLKRANVFNFQLKQQLGTQTIIKSLATKAQAFVLLSKAKQLCVLKGTNVLNLHSNNN
jgi:hypothetical protein